MKILFAAALVALTAVPALAAPHEGMMKHRSGGPGMMMGGGMMGPGGGDRLCHIVGSGHHEEGTLAFLKTELKITSSQQASWDAFATAMKSVHGDHNDDDEDVPHERGGAGMHDMRPLPERMDMHEKMMEARLSSMKKMHAAISSLYSSLGNDQQKMADELLPAFMMCRMRM
jgi:hypothetical protein